MNLPERVVALHHALAEADLPHAFGGAIALAYWTHDPRGTSDIDVNLFVPQSDAQRGLQALPDGVATPDSALEAIARDGQARLWWDDTPVDVFFDYAPVHAGAARHRETVAFAGTTIPILGPVELAVFKAMFDRTRDWADIEAMAAAGARCSVSGPSGEPCAMERSVHEAIAGAAVGAGSLLLVERSRPGALDRAARDAAGQEVAVLRTRARGGDGACAPFDVARDLFGPALAALAPDEREAVLVGAPRLAEPMLAPGGEAPEPSSGAEMAAIHGFYWLAANLAERRPLVLLVEDAHRADQPSLRLCLYLAQRIEELPVALVLATTAGAADEPTGALAALAAQRHARRVTGP